MRRAWKSTSVSGPCSVLITIKGGKRVTVFQITKKPKIISRTKVTISFGVRSFLKEMVR